TNLSLTKWFWAIYLSASDKGGISAVRLSKQIQVSWVTACRILLIAGTQDQHTTQSEAAQLFAAASPPKEFWVVEGAGHYNMHTYAGKTYEERIDDFLFNYLQK
ncbi:MAG: hypothetical protein RQ714_09230, partial [Nitrosomonas sp.]|nr:hypothetical protein [Nitrosomonas sp.]